jgi:galactofuranosylgalactofuranosylrhamnosyl-N-acetylglucosaminyl-diphospho-decaprenol beta-1,5/1,6-galactofuranosyltransferase
MDAVEPLTKVILQALAKFDYNHVEMVVKAFEDHLNGPDFIKNSDRETFHMSSVKLSKSYNNQNEVDKLAGTNLLTRWFKVAAEGINEWSSVSEKWKSASKEMTSTIFWQQYLGLKK